MKLISLTILAFLANNLYGQLSDLKPYGMKSGIINYMFSGAQEGVGTLYFDDFGLRSSMLVDIVENELHKKSYTLTLGEDQYIYDLEKPGEGVKMKNPILRELKEGDGRGILLSKIYGKLGLEKVGKINFQERECDRWTGEQGEALIWNGILLKMDLIRYGEAVHQEATSIEINVSMDPSVFDIPAGIEFTEMPGYTF